MHFYVTSRFLREFSQTRTLAGNMVCGRSSGTPLVKVGSSEAQSESKVPRSGGYLRALPTAVDVALPKLADFPVLDLPFLFELSLNVTHLTFRFDLNGRIGQPLQPMTQDLLLPRILI